MYGQTNCWLHPDIKYVAVQTKLSGKDVFICTERAARNMAYQDFFAEDGKINIVAELIGQVRAASDSIAFGIMTSLFFFVSTDDE